MWKLLSIFFAAGCFLTLRIVVGDGGDAVQSKYVHNLFAMCLNEWNFLSSLLVFCHFGVSQCDTRIYRQRNNGTKSEYSWVNVAERMRMRDCCSRLTKNGN